MSIIPRPEARPFDRCDACNRDGAVFGDTVTGGLYCSEVCARRHSVPASLAYVEIAKEAIRVGWPVAYRRDLTLHDRRFLAALPERTAFLWFLRDYGTHVVASVPGPQDGCTAEALTAAVLATWAAERTRCYSFDGHTLREVSASKALDIARGFDRARGMARAA